jgi:IMP dehydrogenase
LIPDRFAKIGLTFDDVLLIPGKSSVLPRDVDTATKLTADISLIFHNCKVIQLPE